MLTKRLFLGVCSLLSFSRGEVSADSSPSQASEPRPAVVLLFDLRRPELAGEMPGRQEVYAFGGSEVGAWGAGCEGAPPGETLAQLGARISCASNEAQGIDARLAAVNAIAKIAGASTRHSDLRRITERGDLVRTIVLFTAMFTQDSDEWEIEGPRPKLTFEEKARQARIATDLEALFQLALKGAPKLPSRAVAAPRPVTWLSVQDYVLKSERATLGVTASLSEDAQQLAANEAGPGQRQANATPRASTTPPPPQQAESSLKAEIITGPREHWFLSADVPVTKAEQLKLNSTTGELELANEPSAFYIGLNFLLGDLLATKQSLADVLALKLLVKASSHPLDSIGIGVALRGRHLKKYGLNFDLISPFVGVTFTLQDVESADGVRPDGGRNSELRFGVALNLDQALSWAKPK